MAQKKSRTAVTRKVTRKKKPVRRKGSSPGFFSQISITRLVTILLLLAFLLLSVAAVSYVIFFRVVVADQSTSDTDGAGCQSPAGIYLELNSTDNRPG